MPRVRAAAPDIRLGWSLPPRRYHYLGRPHLRPVALFALQILRRTLAAAAARKLHAGKIDAIMAHQALVTPAFARTIAQAGGELYVWTVDDARKIARLEQIDGVTGVITNDPRLFAAGSEEPPATS